MARIDSNRVTITDLPDGLEITIRGARTWQDIMVSIVAIILAVIFIIAATNYSLAEQGVPYIAFIFIGLGVFCYSVAGRLFWLISGCEVIAVTGEALLVKRKGVLHPKKDQSCNMTNGLSFIATDKLRYVGVRSGVRYPGLRGTILFIGQDGIVRFGDMLGEDEANKIFAKMEEKGLIE